MEKAGMQDWDLMYDFCRLYRKKKKYDREGTGLRDHKALERCVLVDQDNAGLSTKEADVGAAYDRENSSCSDVEADPQYMTFLANTKPDGTSYVLKASDQNGLPVFVKYEKEDRSDDEHEYDCQRNLTTDREWEIHGVGKDQDSVREKYKLGSSKALDTYARKNRNTSVVEKHKMKNGILSQKQRRVDRDLGNRKHSTDVKIVPGKEQKTQNGGKFMDVRVKTEPKEDSDSLKEEIPQSEVEIVQNVDAELGMGSSSNPFVFSVEHSENLEDPSQPISNPNASIIDSGYRKEVLNLLMRPYDDEEYKKLWKDIKVPCSSINRRGTSLLSLHKGVNREIKRTNHDKDKKLNIMRGFFFWLEHLTREDAFMPWEDAECLRTMPGSS
ncbi:PREDICTED: uncharacterized protein LOC109213558 isoform X2 [Nicotiana attenuata]|uniref:Uncharacterized protein n=1 Tax=Nicotiana attenuata TaxID=49451 RepID=A0A1J6KSG2_NICAT|nr:PREDICTED: uncharacterized protein LOC109213558 isoform X2 [Nicotiana attenuata]OIT27728.1 hypothetical protein A4A49_20561 [Nicotiana attenuata]